jgi:hypothetical protein
MKRSELKAMIKECVKEALFEEGVLSEIIAEVAFGLTKAQSVMLEQKSQTSNQPNLQMQNQLAAEQEEERKNKILESKKKMLNAIGGGKMSNVFEGTQPLSSGGAPNATAAPQSPLAGRDPNDSGVDISGLFSLAGQKWNALK